MKHDLAKLFELGNPTFPHQLQREDQTSKLAVDLLSGLEFAPGATLELYPAGALPYAHESLQLLHLRLRQGHGLLRGKDGRCAT